MYMNCILCTERRRESERKREIERERESDYVYMYTVHISGRVLVLMKECEREDESTDITVCQFIHLTPRTKKKNNIIHV